MKKTLLFMTMFAALSTVACADEDEHERHEHRGHPSETPEPTAAALAFVGGVLLIAGTLSNNDKKRK